MVTLPRQARDKRRESTQEEGNTLFLLAGGNTGGVPYLYSHMYIDRFGLKPDGQADASLCSLTASLRQANDCMVNKTKLKDAFRYGKENDGLPRQARDKQRLFLKQENLRKQGCVCFTHHIIDCIIDMI
jgi:hypothetical protein